MLTREFVVSDDEEQVDEWFANPRAHNIKVGPRQSIDESVYLLKDFESKLELIAAKEVSVLHGAQYG